MGPPENAATERSHTMRRVLSLNFMLMALLAACVTVNVYFPAAAAEKAADQIIDTVTGSGSTQPQGSNQSQKPQSSTKQPGATGLADSASAMPSRNGVPPSSHTATASTSIPAASVTGTPPPSRTNL